MSRQVHALRQTKTLGGIGCFRSWPKFRGDRNLLYLHPLRLNRRAGHSPSGVFAEPNTHPTERIAYARAENSPGTLPPERGVRFFATIPRDCRKSISLGHANPQPAGKFSPRREADHDRFMDWIEFEDFSNGFGRRVIIQSKDSNRFSARLILRPTE